MDIKGHNKGYIFLVKEEQILFTNNLYKIIGIIEDGCQRT